MKTYIPKDYIGRLGPDHPGVAVFAVDFDDTLCADAYPKIGEPNMKMINLVRSLKEQGHKIILDTCRENNMPEGSELLTEAVVWCRHYDITFDAHNENLPELIERYGGDCRKISADFYVDKDSIAGSSGMWVNQEDIYFTSSLCGKVILATDEQKKDADPIGARAAHIAAMTAAYYAKTDIDPREAVLVERHIGEGTTYFYVNRTRVNVKPDDIPESFAPPDESGLKTGNAISAYPTSAVREESGLRPRPDLISPFFMERTGLHLAKGAIKYTDRNWENGIPLTRHLEGLERHIMQYKMGLEDEDHLAAAACNLMFLIHTEEAINRDLLPDELADLPLYLSAERIEDNESKCE